MEGLSINKEDLAQLEAWIANLPTKYGMDLVLFLNSAKAKQLQAENKQEEQPS